MGRSPWDIDCRPRTTIGGMKSRLVNKRCVCGVMASDTHSKYRIDHALTNVDTIQLYEFNDISTPLG